MSVMNELIGAIQVCYQASYERGVADLTIQFIKVG